MKTDDRHMTELQLREHFALECYKAMLTYIGPYANPEIKPMAQLAVRHADALIKELAA